MSELPLRTRVYTVMLVLVTAAALVTAWRWSYQTIDSSHLTTAAILLVMVVVAELLDVSFPHSVITFHVSVSAAFCFAAGLTAGPLLGGAVVILAHVLDGLYTRREPIKTAVNATSHGLSTTIGGMVYFGLADPEQSTLGSLRNVSVIVFAAILYTLINTGSLALIVSPVMGIGPFQMWRANFGGLYVELITIATLGSLIPVLVRENALSIVLLIVPLLLGPHLAFKGIRQAHQESRIAMEGLANALERRDPYTFRHSIRVTEYVRAILGLMPYIPQPTAEAIAAAAHVHDLGKVGAQDGSLKKPSALTAEERRAIEEHPVVGAEIVSRLEVYKQSVDVIRHHHERWDGSGYPGGLAGEDIPLGSRIIAVADAFDAMTSERVYRPALSVAEALVELRRGQGTQFDPKVIDVFFEAAASGALNLDGKAAHGPAADIEQEPIATGAAPNGAASRRARVAAALVLTILPKLSR